MTMKKYNDIKALICSYFNISVNKSNILKAFLIKTFKYNKNVILHSITTPRSSIEVTLVIVELPIL